MKAPPFAYLRARSLDEALAALAAHGEEARLLAGGQSLVPALNMRLLAPRLLIDINGVAELRGLREQDGGLRIGALTRHAELARSPLVARLAPLLSQAAPQIGHPAIRNRGTLGGSLAFADPAAELPACAIALDAAILLRSRSGARRVRAAEFFKGLYETALAPDEMIEAVELPRPAPRTAAVLLEFSRRRGDYAMAGLAATAQLESGVAKRAKLVFFGLGERPVEANTAARLLEGQPLAAATAAQQALAQDLDPPADLNGGAAVKLHWARVLLARACAALAVAEAR